MKKAILIFLVVALVPILVYQFFVLPRNGDLEDLGRKRPSPVTEVEQEPDSVVASLVENEALIRELNPRLSELKNAMLNLNLWNENTQEIFTPNAKLRDFKIGTLDETAETQKLSISTTGLSLTAQKQKLWGDLIERINYFENVRFYVVRILENRSAEKSFVAKVGFETLGKTKSNHWLAVSGSGRIGMILDKLGRWKISTWDFDKVHGTQTRSRFFEDVTHQVLSSADLQHLQHSEHYETIVRVLKSGMQAFKDKSQAKYFPRGGASGRHPSISVVDVDNDGWDDLYVTEQWRSNLFYRNQGDGTFKECASDYGLDVPGFGSSSIFADFDNDGDKDLFVGKSLRRSQYLENVDGKFIDRSEARFPFKLPFLVTSTSAADYNNDGLLDLYLCTYGFTALPPQKWVNDFLDPTESRTIIERHSASDYNFYLNAVGPRNILLENKGDHFEISKYNSQIAVWANSFQATWADFDEDGDSDLYVANDFAQDYLFRNDGEEGFSDVTFEIGGETMMGFGMGASWGDYDRDGKQDLYVSNMYSKAGIRIVEHFDEKLDSRFRRSADGNRMYRNDGKQMELKSANEKEDGLNVNKAGWSWGGQMFDVDNDGFLDIYVASGYFTAPTILAVDKDL